MGAKDQLEAWSAEQGWSDSTKLDLLCSFIDNLDIAVDMPKVDFVQYLNDWLETQAEWENKKENEEDDGS